LKRWRSFYSPRVKKQAATRDTTVNPAQVDGTQMFPFLAQLHPPPGMYRAIYLTEDDVPVTYLASPDGSWCEINRHPDSTGRHTVREDRTHPPLGGPCWLIRSGGVSEVEAGEVA
jgi:hypothetical protein